jgi:putative nucleotidyltransferase with HDIG domain
MTSSPLPSNAQGDTATLNRVLSTITRLRPLPSNVTSLLRTLESPHADAGKVASLVSLDQALTAYILRVANSASLGYGLSCSSVREAVMRLGFQRVRLLLLSAAASGPLTKRLSGYRLGDGVLWSHSIATASLSHWLARGLSYPDPEEAYAAGLLHDVGKLALDQFVQADYFHILESMAERKLHLWQVEELLFGIDHAGVGGVIADQWQFPVALQDAIRYHHAPSLARKYRELAALVNLANALVPKDRSGMGAMVGHPAHPEALHLLRLEPHAFERFQQQVPAVLKDYEARKPQ